MSTLSDFIPANPINKFVTPASSQDDPIINAVKTFATQVDYFGENLTAAIDEYLDETLYDVMMLRDASRELVTVIGILTKRNKNLLEKAQEIIDINQVKGHTREGNLEIVSKESQGKRSVDKEKLIQERPDIYQALMNNEITSIQLSYTPTITALIGLLKKQHENYLKPGEITTTYDIAVILPKEGERA